MNEINELIKNSDYKMKVFEKELNVSRSTMYLIRIGKRKLKIGEALKLSKLLEVETEVILEAMEKE